MKTELAVQNEAVQKTHGDRHFSVRVCLGTTSLRGSPPPSVSRQNLLAHTLTTILGGRLHLQFREQAALSLPAAEIPGAARSVLETPGKGH